MSENGFGLIQSIITVMVLITSGAFLYKRATSAQKEIRAALYRQELYAYVDRIQDALTDSKVCTFVFGGQVLGQGEIEKAFHQSVGTLFSKGDYVGSTFAFKLKKVYTIAHEGAFAKIRLQLEVEEKFRKAAYIPMEFNYDIPIFAYLAGNTIQECYYDPDDPDHNDSNPDGVISRAIKRICKSPPGDGLSIAKVNLHTMKCHVPGFNIEKLPNIEIEGNIAAGVIFSDDGKDVLLKERNNQFWLRGKNCAEGFMFGVNSDGSLDCRPVEKADVEQLISLEKKQCAGSKGIILGLIDENNDDINDKIGIKCF